MKKLQLSQNDFTYLSKSEMKKIGGGAFYKCLCAHLGDGHPVITVELCTHDDLMDVYYKCGVVDCAVVKGGGECVTE